MAKEYVAGISYTGETAQTVVLEVSETGTQLRFLEEHVRQTSAETWFLDAFLASRDRIVERTSRVSVALDHSALLLYKFPVDTSLTRPEQNEQVHWELSTVLAEFEPKEFINDLHYLSIQAREQTADVFVVNVRRSLIFSIQSLLAQKKFDLHIADANYFGAQHALVVSHPAVRTERVLLVGFSAGRVDVGLLQNGRLLDYHYTLCASAEDAVELLRGLAVQHAPRALFYFGVAPPPPVVEELRGRIGIETAPLNPFERITVHSSVGTFGAFTGSEQRLAASVGIALRKV